MQKEFIFYDIETLENVFSISMYNQERQHVDIYCMVDDLLDKDFDNFNKRLCNHVYAKNKNFKGTIAFKSLPSSKRPNITPKTAPQFYKNLKELICTFGLSTRSFYDMPDKSTLYQIKDKDTIEVKLDIEYKENETMPLYLGYNSTNFDTTVLAEMFIRSVMPMKKSEYLSKTLDDIITPTSATNIKDISNALFTPQFKQNMPLLLSHEFKPNRYGGKWVEASSFFTNQYMIRKNWLMSGRLVDVANLNESQKKVGLKRLLGILGYQIFEPENFNRIEKVDDLINMLAYNVSDCVNLANLFKHKVYKAQFDLKTSMLKNNPRLIYKRKGDTQEPDIGGVDKVRKDRLIPESTSAQYTAKSLAPYEDLDDRETVSFMYPNQKFIDKLKEKDPVKYKDLKQINVLEFVKDEYTKMFGDNEKIMSYFNVVYDYYKSIEGLNLNKSEAYKKLYPNREVDALPEVPDTGLNLIYYKKNGKMSSGYVNFSIGGIHGAEFYLKLFLKHMDEYKQKLELYKNKLKEFEKLKEEQVLYMQLTNNDPTFAVEEEKRVKTLIQNYKKEQKLKTADDFQIELILTPSDYMIYEKTKQFVVKGKNIRYRELKLPESPKKPIVFKETTKANKTELDKKYAYTSVCKVLHQDFESYYPNLLVALMAYMNVKLGSDPYAENLKLKKDYGTLTKDKSLSQKERELYSELREGVKKILNSASGASDATFYNSIVMNNNIVSMRIIGQLFTFLIGQRQTYETSATVVSTNTDGLYVKTDNEEKCKDILKVYGSKILVNIEPEEMVLISKDSNNRVEIVDDKISKVNGGMLSAYFGGSPAKALSHPAIIDYILVEYMKLAVKDPQIIFNPMDLNITKEILDEFNKNNDSIKRLLMYQNIVASSPFSNSYVFAMKDNQAKKIQHYNRVFIMKDGTKDTTNLLKAIFKKISNNTIQKRIKENENSSIGKSTQQNDKIAKKILMENGMTLEEIKQTSDHECAISKVSDIDDKWSMYIENSSLFDLEKEQSDFILNNLDYDKYIHLAERKFLERWMNPQVA